MKNAREIHGDFKVDGLLFKSVVSYDLRDSGPDLGKEEFWEAYDGELSFWLIQDSADYSVDPPKTQWSCTARRKTWHDFSLTVSGLDRDGCVRACRHAAENFLVEDELPRDGLECPECGSVVEFETNAEGLYCEGQERTCQECGTKCFVDVDCSIDCGIEGADGTASAASHDEIEDIGQPKCDGSCGAVKEFVGTPCKWDCTRALEHVKKWKEEQQR